MKYQKIAILGAGAVGCYIYWGLEQKKDIECCIIAEGERKVRFEREGFRINGKSYYPAIKSPAEAKGVDLLIIATKYQALQGALPEIREIADAHTTVISFLNGIDSEEKIAKVIAEEQMVYGVIKVASRRVGNEISFDPETTIGLIYGEKNPARGSERTDALNQLFSGCGLHYRSSDVIMNEIWSKFRLNVPNNQVQAMIGCGVGAYRDSEHVRFLQQAVLSEVDAIAKAKGIDFGASDSSSTFGSKVPDTARYSTLQDLDAGRHTEVDMFSGAIIRMGRELGIPTPYNEFVYHMIKALEEKNDGKFDYE